MARLWYDAKFRVAFIQVAVLGLAGLLAVWLATNTMENLARRGIAVGFDFLGRVARFPISESLIAYAPSDTFARAFAVGLVNTLFIACLIIVGSTTLGLFVGLARRSRHPLAFGIGTVFVEAMRNTPLVVQLLFWYALVTVGLPNVRQALNPLPGTFLSVRGLFVPSLQVGGNAGVLWFLLLGGIAAIIITTMIGRRERVRTGRKRPYGSITAAVVVAALGGTWSAGVWGVSIDTPRLQGFSFVGGTALTPEFASLVFGMILYSACFIGEIIRGGIDAVGKGQWEAGRSLGLNESLSLRLVIIPQALRMIIPPMTSQYFNIVKNTTLALVVGYPDISYVIATTINQTGQAIEGVLILMAVFLTISAAISLFMNWYNRKVALVQR
jgi:general L-amino acid transport system permease protein